MKNQYRTFALLLALLCLLCPFSSCKARQKNTDYTIVCTVFPVYDWVMNIVGDTEGISVSLLVQNGTDPHSYQPSVADIAAVSDCDMLIRTGGVSEAWLDDVLAQAPREERSVVSLLPLLDTPAHHEHDAEHDDHSHSEAYDEHVWLSLKNAAVLTEAIGKAVTDARPEDTEAIESNTEAYLSRLQALDGAYEQAAKEAVCRHLVFADRFPFRYLLDDYGLTYDAAFEGCSAETEISFETVTRLAERIDALSLSHVIITESGDRSLASAVIDNTTEKRAEILVMDSMQSYTKSHTASYLTVMEENLSVLRTAMKG